MTWSLSRLRTYEQCHAKYKYRYLDKLADTFRGPAADRGIFIHKGIEEAIKGAQPVPVEAITVAGYIGDLKASPHPYFAEYNIKLDRKWKQVIVGDYWFHGVLDLLVFPSPEVAHVRDWKTGNIYSDHNEQKALYSLAVFCAFPDVQEVQTFFDYLDKKITIPKVFHRHMMETAKEHWKERVDKMELAEEFIPMPSYGCRSCSFSQSKGGPCRF